MNNNTPPEITCDYPDRSSLGEQNEPFAVTYSVRDEEGDPITVTEAAPAFNFRVSVERGPSGVGGYITSVQGGFQ